MSSAGVLRPGEDGKRVGSAATSASGVPTVSLVGISKTYADNVAALSEVSFDVARGEFVVILGPSGAGKSTLMRSINRLAVPTRGQVFLNGQEITDRKRELRRARGQIGMIFQQFNLVKRLPVITNVLCGRLSHRSTWRSLFYSFTREDRAIALAALAQVGLESKTFQRADTLSGGEQQRVAIARALAQKPNLILADEPVASLDPKNARQVLQCLKQVAAELGISVICNLHQIDYAREYAERIVGLAHGKIVFDGPVDKLTDDVLRHIYGEQRESGHG
ncbi:MAG TPA: phosphonate ABC transporter ATP-binding protein [Casimicrobiaceae bacterium]|jgi:phosphonate transport system ATP-binding protein|nr:phosphonate ABC transporter ATP-binding protein [Casimicrobiaceae bacterium]